MEEEKKPTKSKKLSNKALLDKDSDADICTNKFCNQCTPDGCYMTSRYYYEFEKPKEARGALMLYHPREHCQDCKWLKKNENNKQQTANELAAAIDREYYPEFKDRNWDRIGRVEDMIKASQLPSQE